MGPDPRAARRVIEKIGMTYAGTRAFYDRELVQYAATRTGGGR